MRVQSVAAAVSADFCAAENSDDLTVPCISAGPSSSDRQPHRDEGVLENTG